MKAIVRTWLDKLPESKRDRMSGWIEDHFYKGLDFVLKQVPATCLHDCAIGYCHNSRPRLLYSQWALTAFCSQKI